MLWPGWLVQLKSNNIFLKPKSLPTGWKPLSAPDSVVKAGYRANSCNRAHTLFSMGIQTILAQKEAQSLFKCKPKLNCLINWTRPHLPQNTSTRSALEKPCVDTALVCLAACQPKRVYLAAAHLQDCVLQLNRKSLDSKLKISPRTRKFTASCKSRAVVARVLNSRLFKWARRLN